MLSASVEVVCLMTPMLLLMPQVSSLLQSILHMEVVLRMSIAQHDMQPSPMLHHLLLHAERSACKVILKLMSAVLLDM